MQNYKTDLLDLRRMDCMELMRDTPDNYYSLAICDPPYGINAGKRHTGMRKSSSENKRNVKLSDWDSAIPSPEYFEELFRVSENQIICGGNYFNLPPTRGIICWDKGMGMRGRSFSEWEFIWTSFDRVARLFYCDLNAGGGAVMSASGRERATKIHPTQKPIKLYDYLLHNYAKEGDNILDTHGGSMSLALSCHYKGFHLTACEIDQDYFDSGCERVKNKTAQQELSL